MRVVLFYHSFLSDWNNGGAHFLRGVAGELAARGHEVLVYEPRDAWSVGNLVADYGERALEETRRRYPELRVIRYSLSEFDLEQALEGADLVVVHEWSDPELVRRLGAHRRRGGRYRLLFHDTHRRAGREGWAAPGDGAVRDADLEHYDAILARGEVIRQDYLERGWGERVWTWHEAADTRLFHPQREQKRTGDLVWIGAWAGEDRAAGFQEFVLNPAHALRLKARIYGARYPEDGRRALARAGVRYHGWVANHRVPVILARFRFTVHVPRRSERQNLPGIATIRLYEAMASGIPLLCAPWDDREGLFTAGRDYLLAANGEQMKRLMRALMHDRAMASELAHHARQTILARHTCAQRAERLLALGRELGLATGRPLTRPAVHRAEPLGLWPVP